jgi:alanyl aminopeptidase
MRHVQLAALAAALLACAAHAPVPAPSGAAEAPPLLLLPEGVRPLRYALDLEVVPSAPAFAGTAEIEIELSAPHTSVWMHGRDLRVSRATVEAQGTGPLPASYAQVNEDGVAKLAFPRPIGPGRATLRFTFEGSWGKNLVGLYLARGGGETYAATQLQSHFARRVFPGFDEPRFKTPFDVTLTVPANDVAVSNAPVAADEPARGGRRRVRFATTEPLPTYLLFLGVGPFDVVTPPPLPPNEIRHHPLAVRLLAPKGHRGELGFAAEATAALVPWLERYFAIAFPYAKLDQIALPEFAWGAMENAGAISYRSQLLLDSAATSEEDRLAIAGIMAHEIAHQWFGDLVTLPWWTDTWLNESFATWMGGRATARFRPGWNVPAEELDRLDGIMQVDATAVARAIRQPLRAMAEVGGQFDGMSYQKGAAVLRTFERLVGEDRFRDGVRAYLRAHAHGTGSAEELFAELSRAAGRPLAPALAGFTDRPGMPLVSARVACEPGHARLVLAQERFAPRGSDARREETWQLPLCARWESGGAVREACTLLEGAEGALDLGASCPAWLLPHAGAAAYHRWTLAPANLEALRAAGLPLLTTAEKISFARNLRAAQQAGTLPWTAAMEAIAALASDPDPDAALEPAEILTTVHDRLVAPEARAGVAAYAGRLYRPALSRLGWDPAPGEALPTRRLREATLELLAFTVKDPEVRREAARRGGALLGLDGAPPRASAVDAGLAEVSIAAFCAEGGTPALDALVARLGTLDDASLRQKIVGALGRQDAPALAARAAALWRGRAVRPHEYRYLFGALARHQAGRAAVLAEAERDLDGLAAALPGGALTFFPLVLAGGCDAATAERVRAILEPHLAHHPEMRRALAQALEQIRICTAEREADGAAAAAFFDRAVAARR